MSAGKKRAPPAEPASPLPQFFYGDGITPDPCLRDRDATAKRIQRLEARQASPSDGLDRSFDYDDSDVGDE